MKLTYLILPGKNKKFAGRMIIIFLFLYSLPVFSQHQKLEFLEKKYTVKDVFKEIEKQTGLSVDYDTKVIDTSQSVHIPSNAQTVRSVVGLILENTDCVASYEGIHVLIKKSVGKIKKKVTGRVTDEKGIAIIGANVVEKGTTNGTMTDPGGRFSLDVAENAVIQISYIGYVSQELSVHNKNNINVVIREEIQDLDEVVVIGYGTMKKSDLTGAVASIKGEKIAAISSDNITDILQGKIAGMNIVSSSAVDKTGSIRIRGSRSLNASNDPLVIVDGVPGHMDAVNPNDIESLEVLKDAASTAIYGSRGANGVIMITTKNAKEQKTMVSYSGYFGVNVPNRVKMQSGDQYIQFRRDGYRYRNGWDKPFTDEDVFEPAEMEVIKSRDFTDWIDLLYRNGKVQSHYVSLSSGNKVTKFHLGLNYTKNEGYSKINFKKRFNLTLNLDHRISRVFSVGLSARLQTSGTQGMREFAENLTYMTPLAKPYKKDGTLNYYPAPQNASGYNVLANYVKEDYTNEYTKNEAHLTGYLNISLSSHLNNRANIAYNIIDGRSGYFYGENSYERKGTQPLAGKTYQNEIEYTFNDILTYDNTFKGHHLVLDGVFEASMYKKETGNMSGENQPVASTTYHNLGTAADNLQIGSSYQKWTLASFLARARWDFGGKYYANIAIRADGSSRLADGNKWAYFPSGGVAWRISEEEFFGKREWLSLLKLRVSYGSVGNSAINPYQTIAGLSKYDYLFGEEGDNKFYAYRPSMIPNADLGWEISRTVNAGIDFGLWNNRISGYIEGYVTKTSDLLMQRTLPFFTGFSQVWQNIGKTENKGIELNIQASTLKFRDFNWETGFTFARNWGKITELLGGGDLRNNSWFIGKPLQVWYNYEKIGIWQTNEVEEAKKYNAIPGDIKVKDQNKDDAIGELDKVIIGQKEPKIVSSLLNTFRWKSFDVSININMCLGYWIHPNTYSGLLTQDGLRWMPAAFDYWTPDHPSNEFQRADKLSGYDPFSGTGGYMKGDYIKVQDLTVGYDFGALLPASWGISKTRLYFQVRNLGYIYKACKSDITPEAPDLDYNIPTTYTMGININF